MKTTTAQRLNELMVQKQLRQIDIVERCQPYCKKYGVNIRRSDVSQYCSGKVEPNQYRLTILALALGVNEPWLMGYDVDPLPRAAAEGRQAVEQNLTDAEQQHLTNYRALTPLNRSKVDGYTDGLLYDQAAEAAKKDLPASS